MTADEARKIAIEVLSKNVSDLERNELVRIILKIKEVAESGKMKCITTVDRTVDNQIRLTLISLGYKVTFGQMLMHHTSLNIDFN